MPAPHLYFREATARAKPHYQCADCGAVEAGSTVDIAVSWPAGVGAMDVASAIQRHVTHNNHMPVGWAGYGLDTHRCAKCIT